MVDAVHDQHRDKRDERQPADRLRPPPAPRHRGEHFVHRQLRLEGRFVLPGGIEDVVPVEAVGQFLGHEVAQQQAACLDGHVFVDQREPERLARCGFAR